MFGTEEILEISHAFENFWCLCNYDYIPDKFGKRYKGPFGETHNKAKMTWSGVNEMRVKYATGNFTYKQLADIFCISKAQVSKIITNQFWKESKNG